MMFKLILLAAVLGACQPSMAASIAPETPFLGFLNEAWNKGDFSHLSAEVAPVVVLHFGGHDIPLHTNDVKGIVMRWRAAFPDLKFDVEDMVVQGQTVAVRLIFTGTMTGAFDGNPATGKHMSVSQQTFVRVNDGLITEIWEDYDETGMRRQLGILH